MSLISATLPEEYGAAQQLFQEYANSLAIDLGFQHFEEELTRLRNMYGAPQGALFLFHSNNAFVGCVGIRKQTDRIAELKRMYVQPPHRNQGIAQQLLDATIDFAITAGYEKIRLDTLDTMLPAMSFYQKNGFIKIPAYYFNPEKNAVYYEKDITRK